MAIILLFVSSCTKPTTESRDSIVPFDTHPYWGPDGDHFFD